MSRPSKKIADSMDAVFANPSEFKVDVPAGVSGDWIVDKFTITPDGARAFNTKLIHDSPRFFSGMEILKRFVQVGKYTRLRTRLETVMSDTTAEIMDHAEPIARASGICFVAGLGLGVVAQAMLRNEKVKRVDVVEKSTDVIKLVGDHYRQKFGDRFNLIHADVFDYRPRCDYDVSWFDIWPVIASENLKQMDQLHKKFQSRSGWLRSWLYNDCVKMKKAESRRSLIQSRLP